MSPKPSVNEAPDGTVEVTAYSGGSEVVDTEVGTVDAVVEDGSKSESEEEEPTTKQPTLRRRLTARKKVHFGKRAVAFSVTPPKAKKSMLTSHMETMMREMMEQQRVSLLGELRSRGNLTSGSSSSSTQQVRDPVVRNLATEFFSLAENVDEQNGGDQFHQQETADDSTLAGVLFGGGQSNQQETADDHKTDSYNQWGTADGWDRWHADDSWSWSGGRWSSGKTGEW